MTRAAPPRVVVRAPNWLGDMVMALPAIGAIRHHFEASSLAVAVVEPFVPFFRAVEGVDETVALRPGGSIATLRENAARLGAGHFDVGILLTNSFATALSLRMAGVGERWGYRREGRGLLLTRAVNRRAGTGASRHHAAYYTRLVERLGLAPLGEPARLQVPAALQERARAVLREGGLRGERLVGVAPGAAYGGAKRWPPERAARVIERLLDETATDVVMLGAGADREAAVAVESRLGTPGGRRAGSSRLLNLVGKTDVGMLIGIVSLCQAFLSNDSGAMHLAAACGVHVTAVFGPTDERATAPLGPHTVLVSDTWCRPCHLRECPIDHRCMTRVEPRVVFESIAAALVARGAIGRAGESVAP